MSRSPAARDPPSEDAFWGGRSSYWADPEGNVWEVAWLPPESKMAPKLREASGL